MIAMLCHSRQNISWLLEWNIFKFLCFFIWLGNYLLNMFLEAKLILLNYLLACLYLRHVLQCKMYISRKAWKTFFQRREYVFLCQNLHFGLIPKYYVVFHYSKMISEVHKHDNFQRVFDVCKWKFWWDEEIFKVRCVWILSSIHKILFCQL